MIDPKPRKRIVANAQEWAELRKTKLSPCRLCGKENARGFRIAGPTHHWNESGLDSTLHHIVSRAQRGDDVPENLVSLCGSGTTGCHGLIEARDPWARTLLGERLTAAEREYVTARKSAWWLAWHYGTREAA